MPETRHVEIGDLTLGNDRPLVLIAGPCALESRAHALEMSQALAGMAAGLVVERTFAWLCRNRRLATDFETRVDNAAANLQVAMIKLSTRRLATV